MEFHHPFKANKYKTLLFYFSPWSHLFSAAFMLLLLEGHFHSEFFFYFLFIFSTPSRCIHMQSASHSVIYFLFYSENCWVAVLNRFWCNLTHSSLLPPSSRTLHIYAITSVQCSGNKGGCVKFRKNTGKTHTLTHRFLVNLNKSVRLRISCVVLCYLLHFPFLLCGAQSTFKTVELLEINCKQVAVACSIGVRGL